MLNSITRKIAHHNNSLSDDYTVATVVCIGQLLVLPASIMTVRIVVKDKPGVKNFANC